MKEDFQSPSLQTFADHQARMHERVSALLTGAHPTPKYSGGYGRNTNWATMSIREPFLIDTPETWAQRRVKSDVGMFRMLGPGGIFVPDGITEDLVFYVGKTSCPTSKVKFSVPSNGGFANFSLDPFGNMRLEWIDGDTCWVEGMCYSLG